MCFSIIKSSILVLGFSFISLVHGNDLIAFGKECLVKEERLNKTKMKLDIASLRSEQGQVKSNQTVDNLKRYKEEKEKLETSMTDCNETTPNSAYCHQVRRQYNELNYRISRAEADAVKNDFGGNETITDFEYEKAVFQQEYENFIAMCRDSNAHYALIQSIKAYGEVCSDEAAKKSITCSFF